MTPGIRLEGAGARAQQPGDPLIQVSAGMLGQLQAERVEPKLTEEAFASRFVRLGMEGKLKQFGYNFSIHHSLGSHPSWMFRSVRIMFLVLAIH